MSLYLIIDKILREGKTFTLLFSLKEMNLSTNPVEKFDFVFTKMKLIKWIKFSLEIFYYKNEI